MTSGIPKDNADTADNAGATSAADATENVDTAENTASPEDLPENNIAEADADAEAADDAEPDAETAAAADAEADADDTAETTSAKPSMARPLIAGIAAVAIAAGIAGFAGYNMGVSKERAAESAFIVGPGSSLTGIKDVHRRKEHDPFALGKVDAPIVISYFSDFECPYCTKFHEETAQRIIDEYVNAGLVRLEWNDYAINSENSLQAAEAGRAAAAQGKFFEFTDAAYKEADKRGPGHPKFNLDDLVAIAKTAGVSDLERFREEVESDKYGAAVALANSYAASLGLTGTPMFVVGESPISGAQPFGTFRSVIEAELKAREENTVPFSEAPPADKEQPAGAEQPAEQPVEGAPKQ
ncbi:DsbA family protein [Corynebacterium caspium]|uniref:DsbA family protein n=1 Tax=Corynebacterium caspium TaxID=234828 RepID=UPI0003722794|nr:thioredoxin domain-containing protein [Corynebacterium caspium]WKD59944.1 Disulfide bond formation protein D precursor [Corynebacterium caspium DSM 44850]